MRVELAVMLGLFALAAGALIGLSCFMYAAI